MGLVWFIASILGAMALTDKPGIWNGAFILESLPTSHLVVVATWLVLATVQFLVPLRWLDLRKDILCVCCQVRRYIDWVMCSSFPFWVQWLS